MAVFVLVSGAWSGSWAWRAVVPRLRRDGHDVRTLSLLDWPNELMCAVPSRSPFDARPRRRVFTGSAGVGIRAGLGEAVGPIAEQEPPEEGGGWSAAPPGRCPEHEEVGRVRTLNHIPGTGLVHR